MKNKTINQIASMRDSNMELLRILCMFFVVLLHFNNHGVADDLLDFQGALTLRNGIGHCVEAFAIVAVNGFVLLSGLYGIRFKVKGFVRLFLQCLVCGVVSYLLYVVFTEQSFSLNIWDRLRVFTYNQWWFVTTYLYLYFTAPLLNYAIEAMNQKNFQYVLLLTAFCTFVFGYICGSDMGMSYFHFVFLYLIGRYIGLYLSNDFVQKHRYTWLLLFLVSTMCTMTIAILKQYYHFYRPWLAPYYYNSWFVVAAAIGLLLFCKTFHFQSRIINSVASSALAVYLLQESKDFGFEILYPFMEQYFSTIADTAQAYLYFIVFSVLFFLGGIVIDKIGQVFLHPVWLLYNKIEAIIISRHSLVGN